MMRGSRGSALVETAISISISLLLVLGAAQMALIAYNQVASDGAAFVAAHTAAADPSASPAAVAHGVFSSIPAAAIAASPMPGFTQYSASKQIAGFSLIPGLAQSYTIGGGDVELAPSPPPSTGPYFAIKFTDVLYNYCVSGTVCTFPTTSYSIYLAQTLNPGGSGVNGQFQEWGCHDAYFDAVLSDFPATMPASITQGSALDMRTAGTDEYKIYSWDSGTPCS